VTEGYSKSLDKVR
jgi:hypothetical protein